MTKQHVNLRNFWEAKMPLKNSKKALHADDTPNECLKWTSNKVKEYHDFTSWTFQKLKFRTWLFTLHTAT